MAVIGKIRQRAGLLIGIVGFSLVAFILGDLFTSNRSFLTGSGNELAVIGGKKVNIQDFEAKVRQLEDNYKLNTGNQTVDQATLESLREQAWSQLLNDEIMAVQYNKAGVKVSPEELFDMIQGENPHQQIKEAFKDPKTGEFSRANVIRFLKEMDNDATGKTRAQWIAFEKYISEERVKEKYNELIKHGLFTTTEEAKMNYELQSKTAVVKLIDMNYASISDSSVTTDEKELRDYYNAHQDDFKQEASRKIEYVTFDVAPSQEDRDAAYKSIEKLVAPFRESTDDSLFVALNTDIKNEITFHKKGTLSPVLDTLFLNAPVGTVYGPYEENNTLKVAKLVDVKTLPDSIRVSHALIAYAGSERAAPEVTRTKEQAQKIADSLLAVIKKTPSRFTDIAKLESDDKVSAAKDGDLEWITNQSPMDPKFKEGAFNTKKGEVSLVESPFGFHLIKVTDQTAAVKQVKVAYIDRRIEAGSKTFQAAFSKANEFSSRNRTVEDFDKAVKTQGLNKRVADNLKETDKTIAGLENPRALVQWAFNAKKGDVSKTYDLGNKFVIAQLVEVKEKGIAPMEQVTDAVKAKVIASKKAKMFMDKINAKAGSAKTIEELGAALGIPVKTVDNMSFASSYVQNIGVEPTVTGTVFSLKPGQLSKPIEGTAGVFVVQVEKFNEPAAVTDYSNNKKQAEQQLQQRSAYEVFNSLKEKADITDNRGKYY
jgi:peptidyl-prolyl cis-trans isomerase D